MQQKFAIESPTYTDALEQIISKVRERKPDIGHNHIVIVPDKYTLYVEKRILQNTCGAFDVEVLTLDRLLNKLQRPANTLSQTAAIILLKKIIFNISDKLQVLSKSANKTGFAKRIFENILALKSCNITPEDLLKTSNKKLHDIAAIYSAYTDEITNKYIDSTDRLNVLLGLIHKSALIKNSTVYIANFDTFSPKVNECLASLKSTARACYYTTITGKKDIKIKAVVYKSVSGADAIKGAVRRIYAALTANNLKYNDIGIILNKDLQLFKRIFSENNLPINVDEKYNISDSELGRFFDVMRTCIRQNYSQKNMLQLCANYFCDIPVFDANMFCDYVNRYAIDYGFFKQEFTLGEFKTVEKVRVKLAQILQEFSVILSSKNIDIFNDLFSAFINKYKLQHLSANLASASKNEAFNQIYGKFTQVLVSLQEMLLDVNNSEIIEKTFYECLDINFSILPNKLHAIDVGSIETFRGAQKKLLLFIGADEGELYSTTYDDDVILTHDINGLQKECGISLFPTVADVNTRTRIDAEMLLHSGAELYFDVSSGGRVSYLLDNFLANAADKKEVSLSYYDELIKAQNYSAAAQLCPTAALSLENLSLLKNGQFKNDPLDLYATIYHSLQGEDLILADKILNTPDIDAVTLKNAGSLFFAQKVTSSSQIETFLTCPHKHFFRYGLKLTKPLVGGLEANDIGSLIHKVIELYVSKNVSIGDVDSLIAEAAKLSYKFELAKNEILFERIKTECVTLLNIIDRQRQAGSFTLYDTEAKIGKGEKIEGFTLDDDIALKGSIDRVDMFQNKYALVLDYKTGEIEFKYNNIYFGEKLQLALYLKALVNNGFLPAGAFYFNAKTNFFDDEFSHRLLGFFDDNLEIVKALDNNLAVPNKSEIISATTKVNKTGKNANILSVRKPNNFALNTQQLHNLINYAYKLSNLGVSKIKQGVNIASPLDSACSYCDYKAACFGSRCVRTQSAVYKEQLVGGAE